MTSEEAIEYGKRWYAAIESQGEPAQSDALTFLACANLALQERKTGKWEVKLMRHFAHLLICSNCGADINITAEEYLEYYKRNFRYCPYCGTKMEVDE